MLQFSSKSNFVRLSVQGIESENLPSRGDAEFRIQVASAGFTGETTVWVQADALRAFYAALSRLDEERIGRAELHSMSPRELELVVRSADSRGHMVAEGSAGRFGFTVDSASQPIWHGVHFGFEFDSSQLKASVHEIRVLLEDL